MRSVASVAVVLAVLAAGCVGGDDTAEATPVRGEARLTDEALNDDLTQAAVLAFDAAFEEYLYEPYPQPASAANPSEWEPFYEEGERRVSAMESTFADLVSAVEAGGTGGDIALPGITMDEFVAVTAPWVAAMREQTELSSHCIFASPDPPRCLAEMFAENGDRWQTIADASNELRGVG